MLLDYLQKYLGIRLVQDFSAVMYGNTKQEGYGDQIPLDETNKLFINIMSEFNQICIPFYLLYHSVGIVSGLMF